MRRADLYLDQAAECLDLASKIADPDYRARLIELATNWHALAQWCDDPRGAQHRFDRSEVSGDASRSSLSRLLGRAD
jgi:hypothetical protein